MMREVPNALEILLDESIKIASTVPAKLIEAIYQIEERVQFDEDRQDAPRKIRQALKMVLDEESLEGSGNGNAL